jgi:hypothetical protein
MDHQLQLVEVDAMVRNELAALLGEDFTVRYPESSRVITGADPAAAREAADSLLSDPGIDIIIGLGASSAVELGSRGPLAKPTFAALVFDSKLLGLPSDEATRMGPLQNRRQFEQVTRMIEAAEAEGASVLTGGKRPEGLPDDAQGYFIAPTVLVNVTPDMEIAQQEVFGPVLIAMAFDDEAQAVRLANDTRFGLAGAVWSQDVARAHRVAGQLRAGTVWINSYKAISVMSPFGGFGDSGFGRSSGLDGLREYTVPQSVWVETAPEASVAFGYGSGVG